MEAQKALFPVKIKGKWGLIDREGALVVQPTYEYIGLFDTFGVAVVQKHNLLGAINQYGQEQLPCEYDLLEHLGKGFYSVKKNQGWQVINQKRDTILGESSGKVEVLTDQYLLFETLEGKGLAHIQKGVVLAPKYEDINLQNLPYFVTQDTNNYKGVFDTTGQQLVPMAYEQLKFYPTIILTKKDYKWGIFSATGDCLLAAEWDECRFVGQQFIYLHKVGKTCLFSIPEQRIVAEGFHELFAFSNDYVGFAGTDGKQGLYDLKGKVVFPPKYDTILPFAEHNFRLQLEGIWGILDAEQKEIAAFEYEEINDLDTTVAVVKKDGQYGIMSQDGVLVLDIDYGESLPLENNSVRYKTPNGGLQTMLFAENGQLEFHSKYAKFKSLKASNKLEYRLELPRGSGLSTATQPSTINDSLEWFRDIQTRKWGIRNYLTDSIKIPAQYDTYTNYRDLGFSVAELVKPKIGGVFSLDGLDIKINKVYGIINNARGLPVTRMEFIDIRIDDFRVDSLPVARCVFVGGKHGLIAKNGKVLMRSCAFIGDFEEGKARFTQKGELTADVKGQRKRHVGNAGQYLGNLMSGFVFDGLNNPKEEELLKSKGVLYVQEAKWGFVDTTGVVSIKCRYDYVDNFSNNRAMVQQHKQWGLINEKGNEVLAIQYDNMNFLEHSDKKLFFITKFDQKYGCVDANARVIVAPKYERVRAFKEGRMAVRRGNRWGFVNTEGVEVIPCEYRAVHDFQEGLAAVSVKGRWGYIDKQGTVVIQPKFPRVGDFVEGKAWARMKGGMGYIDIHGKELFKGDYQQLEDFEGGVARFKRFRKGWGLLSVTGEEILKAKKNYKKIESFNMYGLAKVKIGKKYGVLNKQGVLLTKQRYALIEDFSDGHAVIRKQKIGGNGIFKKNFDLGFIDTLGNLVGKIKYRQLGDFHDGRAKYRTKTGWGYINTKGETVIQPIYSKVMDFSNGRGIVYLRYNCSGIVDTNGGYVIKPKVNRIINVNEQLALVKQDYANYFFIHEDLKRHTAVNFQKALPFSNGAAPVMLRGRWGVVNAKGVIAMTPKYGEIGAYAGKYAKILVKDWKGVVNVRGEVVIPPAYEYVAYAGHGLFRVEQENKIGYLDTEGQWVWTMQE